MVSITDLPTEVLMDILSRIPPLCVIGLRGVCKRWRVAVCIPRELLREIEFQVAQQEADSEVLFREQRNAFNERFNAINEKWHIFLANYPNGAEEAQQAIQALRVESARNQNDFKLLEERISARKQFIQSLLRKMNEPAFASMLYQYERLAQSNRAQSKHLHDPDQLFVLRAGWHLQLLHFATAKELNCREKLG